MGAIPSPGPGVKSGLECFSLAQVSGLVRVRVIFLGLFQSTVTVTALSTLLCLLSLSLARSPLCSPSALLQSSYIYLPKGSFVRSVIALLCCGKITHSCVFAKVLTTNIKRFIGRETSRRVSGFVRMRSISKLNRTQG